ncbi:hypothetical protein GCM10010458_05170 [Microbacterium luteolum]|uniref:DUF4209 domain-containing protein n=1 Tax=Microbacterium luteolum TaxID=69367 RepID=A0ABY7XMG2_MICLT|nr:hypothetical protein [Microbacterium luteolum]WDM43320.1 hypothetical protein KV395_08680 [Microbacterium luteolum]
MSLIGDSRGEQPRTPAVDREDPHDSTSSEYLYESGHGEVAARILDRLGATAGDPLEISFACHGDGEFGDLSLGLQSELTTLLGFELDDKATGGSVALTPVSGPRIGLQVRPVGSATHESHTLWRSMLASTKLPILVALLCDSLLTARAETGVAHAARTVAAYCALGDDDSVDSLHRALAIGRANSIARGRRMLEEEAIRQQALRLATSAVGSHMPDGVVARVVVPISATPATYALTEEERAQVRAILDLAATEYRDPSSADWIADCRRSLATTSSERLEATREQVAVYLATAESEDVGFRRMHWAATAADLAGRYGDTESRDRAVRLMQSIPPESMGWQAHESVVRVPTSALRSHIRRYKFAGDWRQALRIFLASKSPAGNHEQNIATARASSVGSIRSLFSRVSFGSHGLPERSDSDFDEEELVRTEQVAIRTHGILLDLELNEMERRFGRPAASEIGSWLSVTFNCDPGHAFLFARALHLHWRGEPSDSARIAIPLIEAGARRLLLLLGEPLYRIERGASPGRFPAMDFYLDKLEELDLDVDWVRAVRTTLLDPGMNLRNMAAHGFKFEFAASEGAVLLRLAGLFCAMPIGQDSDLDPSPLKRPTMAARQTLRRRLRWEWN